MRVIGVGDNVVDKYLYKKMMYPGGNALNFSVYAKQLGMDTAYLGVFGDDQAAHHIIKTLKSFNIDISHCRQHPGENGYAAVDLVEGDRVFIGGNEGGVQKDHPVILSKEDLDYIQTFELAHSSIYSDLDGELHKLKEAGVLVSFDFSTDYNESVLKKICPHVDISLLSCGQFQTSEVEELLRNAHSLGCSMVIGTMGSRGAMVYNGTNFFHKEPHYVKPVDTLGAGDSFFTAYILEYLKGRKQQMNEDHLIKQSLEAGAKFAAQTCLVEGAFGFGLEF
jgi:fructoselysine 6-kinase